MKGRIRETPPPFAQWLICRFLRRSDRSVVLGDFDEHFTDILEEKGPLYAKLWYWAQLFKSIPAFVLNRVYRSISMFRNYFKVSLRNMKRHKTYSIVNILGLGVGLACVITIFLWVADELSFDRFHRNVTSLYRVESDRYLDGRVVRSPLTPAPLAPRLRADVPEIAEASRYEHVEETLVRCEDRSYYEDGIWAVDPSFLKMFSFPLSSGDESTALNGPRSVVLTESAAIKYFGDRRAVGRGVTFNNRHDLTVTGVVKDLPRHSSLRFGMLVSFEFLEANGVAGDNFRFFSGQTFVQLSENAVVSQVNKKIAGFLARHDERSLAELELVPLAGIHLHSYSGAERAPGDVQYVYLFSAIAVIVLLIACINFMNLSTARSANRAKEIGLRKVVGAERKDIVKQFFSESLFHVVAAQFVALLLVGLFLPAFNGLAGKDLDWRVLFTPAIGMGFVGVTTITVLIAGSYPAIFLSAFRPARILGGRRRTRSKGPGLRRWLVLVQFSLSIVLIVGTAVVYRQLDYMRNEDLGYDKERLVYVPLRGETRHSYGPMKRELERTAGIAGVTGSGSKPSAIHSQYLGAEWDGKLPGQEVPIGVNAVGFDFVETLKIAMKEGRSFSEDRPEDVQGSWIVNEELVRVMGVESAVGMRFSHMGIQGRIVGVMKDFRFRSARERTVPLALTVVPERLFFMLVRLQADKMSSALRDLARTWDSFNPDYPWEYRFLDEDFDSVYGTEKKMGRILGYFSLLAVTIAGLGLFGLSSFVAEQRTKEIGIRKILGASPFGIVHLLSREFSRWVLLANIVAWPIGWFVTHQWLGRFAYRTGLSLWPFLLAGGLSFVIAGLSVCLQAFRAAVSDPVVSLRYE